jgi:hypothetical protein
MHGEHKDPGLTCRRLDQRQPPGDDCAHLLALAVQVRELPLVLRQRRGRQLLACLLGLHQLPGEWLVRMTVSSRSSSACSIGLIVSCSILAIGAAPVNGDDHIADVEDVHYRASMSHRTQRSARAKMRRMHV